MLNSTLVIPNEGITNKIAILFAIVTQFFSKHSRLAILHFLYPRSRISSFTYTSGQIFKTFYL